MKRKMKTVKASKPWSGERWVISSPWQTFEYTISNSRNGAWELFRYVVHEDVDKYKREGWKAVKCNVSFRPLPKKVRAR